MVSLARRKAEELAYPREVWSTRSLARLAREGGPTAGHACLVFLAQSTVCKTLDQHEVKPHERSYYLQWGDADF